MKVTSTVRLPLCALLIGLLVFGALLPKVAEAGTLLIIPRGSGIPTADIVLDREVAKLKELWRVSLDEGYQRYAREARARNAYVAAVQPTELIACEGVGWFAHASGKNLGGGRAEYSVGVSCGFADRTTAEREAIRMCETRNPNVVCRAGYSGYDDGTVSFSDDPEAFRRNERGEIRVDTFGYGCCHAQYSGADVRKY